MMMNSINKTMYIPLFGKSYVSKKGIILQDKMAEEILEGNIKRGDKVVLSVSKKDIKFSVND